MDGSRRYSKVYGKTQSGVDALTKARGTLSSSARQLLILLDGHRDFDELTGIFGEETLYRLLPQLESQGYIEPLEERSEAQHIAATPTTPAREAAPTVAPKTVAPPTTVLREPQATVAPKTVAPPTTVLREPQATIAPKTVARSTTILREPQTTIAPKTVAPARPRIDEPAAPTDSPKRQRPAKSPRSLALPIAIAATVVAALVLLNGTFERGQRASEAPQTQDVAPDKTLIPNLGTRSATAPSASGPVTEPAPPSSPAAIAQLPISPRVATLPPAQSRPAMPEVSTQTVEMGSVILRGSKTPPSDSTAASSKAPAMDASAQSAETASRAAPRAKTASESVASASKPAPARPVEASIKAASASSSTSPELTAPQVAAPAPAVSSLHVRSRVLPTISKRALQSGIYSGSALVRLHINSKGAVERVELVSANPPEVYGPDVQQALEQWTFEPPSNPAQFTLELDFRQQAAAAATEAGKSAASSRPQEVSKPAEVSAPVDAP